MSYEFIEDFFLSLHHGGNDQKFPGMLDTLTIMTKYPFISFTTFPLFRPQFG